MKNFFCKDRFSDLLSCFFILIIVFSIFAILWLRSSVVAIEYKLSQLEEKKKNLIREQKLLIAEKSSITSLAKIEKGEVCYLRFPDRSKVVYVNKDSNILVSKVNFGPRE